MNWIMISNSAESEFAQALREMPGHPGACHDGENTLYTVMPTGICDGGVCDLVEFVDLPEDEWETIATEGEEANQLVGISDRVRIVAQVLSEAGEKVLRAPQHIWRQMHKTPQWRIWCASEAFVDQFEADKEALGLPASLTQEEAKEAILNAILNS